MYNRCVHNFFCFQTKTKIGKNEATAVLFFFILNSKKRLFDLFFPLEINLDFFIINAEFDKETMIKRENHLLLANR